MKVLYNFQHTVCQIFHPTLFAVVPVLSCVYLLLLPGQPVLLPALPRPLWQCYSKLHLLQKIGLSQVFFSFQNQESPSCLLDRLLILKNDFTLFSALSLATGCGCGGAAGEGPERGSSAGNPPGRRARSKGRGARRAGSVPGAGQAGRAGLSGSGRQRPTSPSRRYPHRAAAETAGTGPREEPQPERRLRRRSRGGATGAATRSPGSSCGLSGAPRHEGDTRRAECPRLSRGELRVARGAGLLPPGSATASCWGCAGGSAAGRDRQWGGGPGRPRGGSSGPARRLPSPSVPRTEARNVN